MSQVDYRPLERFAKPRQEILTNTKPVLVKRSHKKKPPDQLIRHPRKVRKLPRKSPKRLVSKPLPKILHGSDSSDNVENNSVYGEPITQGLLKEVSDAQKSLDRSKRTLEELVVDNPSIKPPVDHIRKTVASQNSDVSFTKSPIDYLKKELTSQNSAESLNKKLLDSIFNDSGSITTIGHVNKLLELVKSVFDNTGKAVTMAAPLMETVWGISYSLSTIFIQGLYKMGLYLYKHWMVGNIMFAFAYSMSSIVSSYLQSYSMIGYLVGDESISFLPELKGASGMVILFGGGFVSNMLVPIDIVSSTITNTIDLIIGGPIRFVSSKISSSVKQRYDDYGFRSAVKFVGALLVSAGLLWLSGPVMISLLKVSGIPGIFSVLQKYMSSVNMVDGAGGEPESFLTVFIKQFMINAMLSLETLGIKSTEYDSFSDIIQSITGTIFGNGGGSRTKNTGSHDDIVHNILKGVASMLKGTNLIAVLSGQVTAPVAPDGDALNAWGNNMDTTLLVPSMIYEAMGKGKADEFIKYYQGQWSNVFSGMFTGRIYTEAMGHWKEASQLPIGQRVFVCIKVLASYIGSCFPFSTPLRSLGGIAIATLLVGLAWRHLNKPGPVNRKDFEKLVEIYGYHVIVMNTIQRKEHEKNLDLLVSLNSKNIKALKGVNTVSKLYNVMNTENEKLHGMLSDFMKREPGSYVDTEYIDRALPNILQTINQYSIELQLLIKNINVERETNINNAQISLMRALDTVQQERKSFENVVKN